MLSLTSKTCTKYSMIFFVCSIFLGTLLVMRGSVGIIVKSFHNLSEVSLVLIYYLCFLLSGLSLLFSTGVYATSLKKWTAIVHFGCLYWVLYILIGFIGIQRYDLIAYLLLTIWLLKKKGSETRGDHLFGIANGFVSRTFYRDQSCVHLLSLLFTQWTQFAFFYWCTFKTFKKMGSFHSFCLYFWSRIYFYRLC